MIKIKNATIKRNNFEMININLEIKSNQIIAILGKNASGKSSLLHLLTGALPSNMIKQDNLKLAFVDENWPFNLGHSLNTIGELIQNIESSFNAQVFNDYLLKFKIEPHDIYAELSTGNQKMSLLAYSLARNPDLLILDEILLNIDEYRKHHFNDILLEFMSVQNRSIVISTNQIDVLEDIVDEIIYLKDNQIIYQGSILNLKTNLNVLNIKHEEIDSYKNVLSTIRHDHYLEICVKEKNDGSSDILDIINHLERINHDQIHL